MKRAAGDPLPSQVQDNTQPPAIIAEDTGEQEWFVEEILEARRRGSGHQVLVKWTGYTQPTWEPLGALQDTEALDKYEATHGKITTNDQGEKRGIITG